MREGWKNSWPSWESISSLIEDKHELCQAQAQLGLPAEAELIVTIEFPSWAVQTFNWYQIYFSSIISVPAGRPSGHPSARPPQTGKVCKLSNSNKLAL
jgi:hypothetical protein